MEKNGCQVNIHGMQTTQHNPRGPVASLHYGWIIVMVGTLVIFACLGLARFAFGMLLPSMSAGLGISYDEMGFFGAG